MKRVEYKKLSIQNFLSIGRDPVVIEFTKGIHIITGVNKDKTDRKNGVGKSAIACAFYFAHFGEAIRNIKKDLIVNDVTNGKVEVILDVDVLEGGNRDRYQICRNLKPSRLSVTKNGKDVTLSTIPKTTEYICNVLGVTPSLATNCIIMTINDTTPFMAKPKAEKRKFIEDVFDLDVFGRMLTVLKRDFREAKKDVEVKDTKVTEIKHSVKTLKDQKEKLEKMKEERVKHYEKRRNDNVKERDALKELIKTYKPLNTEELEKQVEHVKEVIKKLISAKSSVLEARSLEEYKLENEAKILEDVRETAEAGMCFECKRPYSEDAQRGLAAKIKEMEDKLEGYRVSIKAKGEKREKLVAKITEKSDELDELLGKIKENIVEAENRKTNTKRLEQIDGWIAELDRDIATVKSSNDEFTGNIKVEADRLRKEAMDLKETREHYKVLESSKFVLGDEGVKTRIIRKLIDLLNKKLVDYIRKLDGNCICKFNEYFEEEIINTKGKVRSYFNFSGAEKKAVDLGCLFSFSDIKRMQGGVSYNVSMYDELFDSSLDETGVNLVIDILNERVEANDECVMIISHRKEAIKAVTGEIIYLEKRNDITKRVDFEEGKL